MSSYFTRAKDDLAYNERVFVEGRGHFVDDIIKPGALHMSIVRSPYARAKILSIKGGMSSKDLGARMASVGEGAMEGKNSVIQPVFATGYVNYVGEAVAAVFADDRYKSEDLLDSVEVEYEPVKPVVSIEDALSSPPIHHQNWPVLTPRGPLYRSHRPLQRVIIAQHSGQRAWDRCPHPILSDSFL